MDGVTGSPGRWGPDSAARMKTDARRLRALAKAGEFAVDPHSARALANIYEDMAEEIDSVTGQLRTAVRRLQLGSSPYAWRVSNYQHETVDAFHDAAVQLRAACMLCAETYREAANHYVRFEQDTEDAFRAAGSSE